MPFVLREIPEVVVLFLCSRLFHGIEGDIKNQALEIDCDIFLIQPT